MTAIAVPDAESDAELKARFTAEVCPLVDVLSRGARRLTRNDADAEDLLQETLLRAYRGFRTFEQGTNLKAWLFRIQHNEWVNAHRRHERRPAEVLSSAVTEQDRADHATHVPVGMRSAESEVLEFIPRDEVRRALMRLSEGSRMVLYYADVEGYTYAETAALMGIPIGTVMSRASRARRQLRRALSARATAPHCRRLPATSAPDHPNPPRRTSAR